MRRGLMIFRMNQLLILVIISVTNTFFCGETKAQKVNLLSLSYEEQPLNSVLEDLENRSDYKFFYKPDWFREKTISISIKQLTASKAILQVLNASKVSYDTLRGNVFILYKVPSEDAAPRDTIKVYGQVTGYLDSNPVVNAVVSVPKLNLSTVTGLDGKFEFDIIQGTYLLTVKSLNSDLSREVVQLYSDTEVNFEIFDQVTELEDVVVSASNPLDNINETTTGKVVYSVESIKKLPTLLGEIDLSRIILSLPGVQNIGEGSSGFNIRGGAIDQNLILLDDVPLYNSSHLLGFFSIFNPDMVSDFTVYKGDIPARYGGRLSSVIGVSVKKPDLEKFKLSGGIGPVSNKLNTNIPILKDKLGIASGFRFSDPTWILRSVDDPDISQSSARFNDLTTKISYNVSEKSTLSLNYYRSFDLFDFGRDTAYQYESEIVSLNWNQQLSSSLFASLLIYQSSYEASFTNETENLESIYDNGIKTLGSRLTFDYSKNSRSIFVTGIESKYSVFDVGTLNPSTQSSFVAASDFGDRKSIESGLFIENERRITNKLTFKVGLRGSIYHVKEDGDLVFEDDIPKSEFTVVDTIRSNGFNNLYNNLEPRTAINWVLNGRSSVKASYTRSIQYKHLFSESIASLPTDLWLPTNRNISFTEANLFSAGYFRNFANNMWEFSAEAYYKSFPRFNIVNTGSRVIQNRAVDAEVLRATGQSYGLELFVKKNSGKATGWISYFISRTEYQTVNDISQESINQGNSFLADFDRPHNFNLSIKMELSRLWSMSSNFIFTSGRPITLPTSSYVINGNRVLNVTERNNLRIPSTHRLDLSWTYEGTNKLNKRWKSSFTFSVYNLYGRNNPFSIVTRSENNFNPRTYNLSVFGNAIPSFTYNFKFQ